MIAIQNIIKTNKGDNATTVKEERSMSMINLEFNIMYLF